MCAPAAQLTLEHVITHSTPATTAAAVQPIWMLAWRVMRFNKPWMLSAAAQQGVQAILQALLM
jgi:hypothetical protein